MSARAGKWSVFRHVFTSAPDDFPGGGGFRTVACAAALRDMVPQVTLEFLVESFKNQEGGGVSCRQFVPLARGAKAYAFTVFTSLADSPDGRTGNFWAETQVVPIDWLEQAGWDAAAAFDALSWLGPRDLGRLPRDLAPEPLAPLESGSIERLARLGELVPPDCLETLLHAVGRQSRGLRPLRLLEAQGKPARHLEEVVMLLPLTVPPTSRRYHDDDQFRCLTLRTRCPVGGMAFRTDVTGYPAAAADGLELSDGFVIDLAGRLRSTSTDDRFGRDYAHWLAGVIQQGDWDRLARLYQQAINFPGGVFFAHYKSLLEAPSRSRVATAAEVAPTAAAPKRAAESGPGVVEAPVTAFAPPTAVPEERIITPVQDWQRDSAARDEVEGALWKLRENHRSQIEELIGKIGKDFAADVDKASSRLVKEVAGLREGLDTKLKEFDKDLKKVEKAGKRTQQQTASAGRDAGSVEARLEKLENDLAEVTERLAALGGTGGVSTAQARRSFRAMLASSRDWIRNHRRPIFWATGIGVVVAVLVILWLRSVVQISPGTIAPDQSVVWRKKVDTLVQRVQPGRLAARLLENASKAKDVAPTVHAATLAVALSHGVETGEKLDCALLQAALQAAEPGISVDGDCGSTTLTALEATPKADCCRRFSTADAQGPKKIRNCFITDSLQLALQAGRQEEACRGESPWREGRHWTEDEASRALSLFQMAARSAKGAPDSELAKSLRSLDPSQSSSLRDGLAGKTLTRDEARRVLELAWAGSGGIGERLDELTIEQLEELDRIIDRATSRAGNVQPQGGSASDGANRGR